MSFSLLFSFSFPMNSSYMFFSFSIDSFCIPFFLSHSHPMNSSRLSSSYSKYSFSMFFSLSQTCYMLHDAHCMLNF